MAEINAKNAEAYVKEREKWAEMDRQVELNRQINAEMDVYSNNYTAGNIQHNSQLPYTRDYLQNYSTANLNKSNDKIFASFDNERNYVQQWLTKHGFKNLQELRDNAYIPNITHYKDQELAAINQYFKLIEQGKLPQNCSYGDWIRYILKDNPMKGWNWLVLWKEGAKIDFGLILAGSNTKFVLYQDCYNNNVEIEQMIDKNLPIISSFTHITKEQKTQMVESLISGTFLSPMGESISGLKTAADFRHEVLNKWNTEYLPNIKD